MKTYLITLLFLLTLCTAHAQIQLGTDIDGEAAYDGSGHSVSLSSNGSRLAIGAPGNDGNGTNAGHVRIYEWTGNNWAQMGIDIDGEFSGDYSGYSVSLSSDGNRIAIGATYNDGIGIDGGHVRLFEWTAGSWVQLGIDLNGEAGEHLGSSLTLSSDGNRVAIGAPDAYSIGPLAGRVLVFDWTGNNWARMNTFQAEAYNDFSGGSVSLSSDGSRLAIGAIGNNGNGTHAGHVRIYECIGSNWTQLGADIDGESVGDLSGRSVSLSSNGSRIAIGADKNGGNGIEAGHVRIYEWTGNSWAQLGVDIDGEAAYNYSGRSVSLSSDGSRVAIGATYNSGNGIVAGHVRVYEWTGNCWSQLGLDVDGEAAYDYSGSSVSLSADGKRLAIGASGNDGSGYDAGHVRVYSLQDTLSSQYNKR